MLGICFYIADQQAVENLLTNFIDSDVEEDVQTAEIQLASFINQLQNTNPMYNTEALLTDNEIFFIRTVTAEDDDDDDVTPVNSIKISHSEAVAALNTSLEWAEEQNFEAHVLLRRLRHPAFELKIGTVSQKNH
ncbi:hypothetical protein AVEN_5917-1 [Araneus ventricosus]|uniref:Uncharacterized protein n=1 Tax=Araneus ventricosus TaxID=182803 RepID=A0A4Y2EYG0_ARAVE|nr:hypothetical protein AVEN_5917-1 [Araneus ventricosus]